MSSIIEQAPGIIIESDHSGRTRYTAQYKQEVVAAFESSSLSAPDFARQCGIKYPTFAAWVAARKRDGRPASRNDRPAFLIAELSAETGAPPWKSVCPAVPLPEQRMPDRSTCLPSCCANLPEPAAMLTFNGSLKVYVALEPCDMCKSFNTLAALARNHLGLDPLSGAAFLFTNKSRRLIKILYLDGTGYWLGGQAARKGHIQLAQGHRGRPPKARDQAHRAGHARRRHRSARRPPAPMV
jgi:transposase